MIELDPTDRRILAVLQRNGRITNAELAAEVALSASACHRRVQRLEETGLIRGYVALLDARKLERPTTVFVEITLSGQADELLDAFERAVRQIPDVLECHLMAGSAEGFSENERAARLTARLRVGPFYGPACGRGARPRPFHGPS